MANPGSSSVANRLHDAAARVAPSGPSVYPEYIHRQRAENMLTTVVAAERGRMQLSRYGPTRLTRLHLSISLQVYPVCEARAPGSGRPETFANCRRRRKVAFNTLRQRGDFAVHLVLQLSSRWRIPLMDEGVLARLSNQANTSSSA